MYVSFVCLPSGMIAHGHVDVKYAHYGLDFYPGDANHTVGSFAKLLRDLESPPTSSSRALFAGCGTTPIYEAVLEGKEVCLSSLQEPPEQPVLAKPLPPTLHVQLDNCAKDNKCRYVFCFWSLLVAKGIFKEVFVSFLMVGHTHDDIDASFGRWSMKLHEEDFPTIPLLMKSYMDLDNVPVIPHLIEEVPDFKSFIKPFILKGGDRLVGHTKAQQFRFYMRDDGQPAMQFKILCTSPNWGPEEGILVWSQNEDGKCMLPDGEPKPCTPSPMRNGPEIIKGISGFIQYWKELCEEDITRRVRDTHEPLIAYWERIRSALLAPDVDTHSCLTQGFWPQSRVTVVESEAMFFNNGDVREEFAADDHYVGPARNRPAPSFRVGVDCHEGYLLLVRAGDEEHPKPIWLVKALSSPNFVPTSPNFHQIEVEYYRPSTKDQNVFRTYLGWDTKKVFKWTMDSTYEPVWISTDTILCAWKPRKGSKSETMTIPQKHIDFAKDNLARIATAENDVENGNEAEDEDGE